MEDLVKLNNCDTPAKSDESKPESIGEALYREFLTGSLGDLAHAHGLTPKQAIWQLYEFDKGVEGFFHRD